jgi:hypothetical protein
VTYSVAARDPQAGLAAGSGAGQGLSMLPGEENLRFVRAGLPEMTGRPPAARCGWPDRSAVPPPGVSDRQPRPGDHASRPGLSPAAALLS